jgi:hypothetical protein
MYSPHQYLIDVQFHKADFGLRPAGVMDSPIIPEDKAFPAK